MDFQQANDFFNNCKFSKLKEYLEEAKSTQNKDLEGYIRKVMTRKYLEHKQNKIKNSKITKFPASTGSSSVSTPAITLPIINNQPTPLPPIPSNPTIIQYNNKNDKYSNILANQIGIRNRLDSNLSILESIKNNNKNDFIKPYV